jgi:hypothetical protein
MAFRCPTHGDSVPLRPHSEAGEVRYFCPCGLWAVSVLLEEPLPFDEGEEE